MQLSQNSIKNLKNLLQTVSIVKIDRVIIEDGVIRGVDEDQTVVIISDQSVPDFGEAKVGLNRLSVLANRINMFDANEDFSIDAVETESRSGDGTTISAFKLSSKGSKFEYRAARVETIKAPKRINDTMAWGVTVLPEVVKVVIAASNSMGSEQIALVAKQDGEVFFEIVDGATQDTFTTKIADSIETLNEDGDSRSAIFVNYYATKALVPLLKAASAAMSQAVMAIGEEGMLQITVNGHTFTLLPREGE